MRLFEKIRGSFSAQLSIWVAGFVIVISAVVCILLARFSEQVIRDESRDTTQQSLENTAQRIRDAIFQAQIIAHLEHKSFQVDKAYIERLLNEKTPLQLTDIRITDRQESEAKAGVSMVSYQGEPAYRFYAPIIENQYGLIDIIPANSFYSHYKDIQHFLLWTSIVGLIMLLAICCFVIVRHLRPLRHLAGTAQRIAGGHLDEPISVSSRKDEIGRLQNSLAKMQRSLNSYLEEIRSKQSMLSSQNAQLQEAYSEIKEYEKLKDNFISEMTTKMSLPVK